jgi:Fe-S-cluster containining protein
MEKIPVTLIEELKAEAIRQAEVNIERLNNTVDLVKFEAAFKRVNKLDIPKRAKAQRFLEVAGEFSKAVRPFTACKANCSYCCSIATIITETEAQIMGKAAKRKPKKLDANTDHEAGVHKWRGVPCPFLVKGKCSIYEARPMACRLHQNLADSPHFCNTEVPPGESIVPQINLKQIHVAHGLVFIDEVWADIRDFFPPKA